MSLYIGRDNSGNGIFHATKDEQSETSLKAGVNEKTIFHSDIPFIRVGKTYTLSLTEREPSPGIHTNAVSTSSEYWAFPSSMETDLRSNYVFLGFATLSDGAIVQIQCDKFSAYTNNIRVSSGQGGGNWTWYQFGHSQEWGGTALANGLRFAFPTTDSVRKFNEFSSTGYAWFTNYSTTLLRAGAGGWFGYKTTRTLDSTSNQPPYLHRDSKGVLITRCSNGKKGSTVNLNDTVSGKSTNTRTPYVTAIKFYRLDVTADSNGYYNVALPATAPGEFFVDNSSMKTNGIDQLSNLQYFKFRGWHSDGASVSPTTPGGIVYPANCYNYSQSVSSYPNGIFPSYTETVDTGGGTAFAGNIPSFRKPYAVMQSGKYRTHVYGNFVVEALDGTSRTITPTSAMNAAISASGSYNGATYELVTIPSVNSVEFDNTSLTLNGNIDLYTSTNQPIACIGQNRTLTLSAATRTISPGGVVANLEASINLGSGLGTHLHILFGSRAISTSDQYVYSKWNKTGGTLSFNPPSDARTSDPDLGPQLAALPQNAYVHIGTMRVDGNDRYSPPDDMSAVGVSLCLRYTGTTIQLWTLSRHVSTTTSTMQYRMPRINVNLIRLTSG